MVWKIINMNKIAVYCLILFISTLVIVILKLLLSKYIGTINVLYYFIPAFSVLITDRGSGFSELLNEYKINFKSINIKQSLFYVLVFTFVFPILCFACVYFFCNMLDFEQFGIFSIPQGNFSLYGIAISDN